MVTPQLSDGVEGASPGLQQQELQQQAQGSSSEAGGIASELAYGASYKPSKDSLRLLAFAGEQAGWRQWSAKFLARAALVGTRAHYDGSIKRMYQAASSEDQLAMKVREQMAYAELVWCCSDVPFYLVDGVPESEEWRACAAWAALREKYDLKSSARKVELRREFADMRMGATEDPDDFVLGLEYLRRKLADHGVIISDTDFVTEIVCKLPAVYSELVTILELKLDELSVAELQQMLRTFYRRKLQNKAAGAALFAAEHGAGTQPRLQKPGGSDRREECPHCHKLGHSKAQCWALHPEQRPKWLKDKRGRPGKGGGNNKRGQDKDGKVSNVTSNLAFTAVVAANHAATHARERLCEREHWVVDSGCTNHLTNSAEHMVNVRLLSDSDTVVKTCDGSTLPIVATGDLPCIVECQSGPQQVTLRDVMVAPAIGSNLLSVQQATKGGVEFNFSRDGSSAQVGQHKFVLGREALLWRMELRRVQSSSASASTSTSTTSLTLASGCANMAQAVDVNVLHQRLGHVNEKVVRQVADSSGFQLTGEFASCSACALGKSCRHAVPKVTDMSVTEPLELVGTDCFGPIFKPSIGKTRYGNVYVDYCSRFAACYFLPTKDVAYEKLDAYVSDVALPFDRRVRTLRSDNGGEFSGSLYTERCASHGILQQFTPSHTPEMNGVAESTIRTLLQRGSAMLQQAQLGVELWAEAVNTATYLYNRTPHTSLDGKTPYEAYTGNAPTLKHLRTFGALCYVHVEHAQRRKFQPRSVPGILVGYARNKPTNCYRVYVPRTQRVHETMHVTIHEGIMYSVHIGKPFGTPFQLAQTGASDESALTLESCYPPKQQPAALATPAAPTPSPGTPDVSAPPSLEQSEEQGAARIEAIRAGGGAGAAAGDGDGLAAGAASNSSDDQASSFQLDGESEPAAPPHQGMRTRTRGTTRQFQFQELVTDRGGAKTAPQRTLPSDHRVLAAEVVTEPQSYDEALRSEHRAEWLQAKRAELQSLLDMHTWDEVELPEGRRALKTRDVYKVKLDSAGRPVRFKCRTVVQGFAQQEGVDFFDTYAPVADITTVRTVLAVAAVLDWELEHMDVDTAFLNAPVQEEIYVTMPPGYKQRATGSTGKPLVCRLRRSLYGLKQAPRNWNSVMNTWLVDYGFVRSAADPCLYVKFEPGGGGGTILVVVLYVDDLIIASNSASAAAAFKSALRAKFKVKDLGALEFFVGIRVTRDRGGRALYLDQNAYLERVLERYNMADAKPLATPASSTTLSADMCPSTASAVAAMESVPYRSAVGSLLYAAVCTRPDMANAVRCVSRYMHNPGEEHWAACKRIMRYIKGTLGYRLSYSFGGGSEGALTAGDGEMAAGAEAPLVGYCDADYAGDVDRSRSTTGYVFMLGTALISWSSRLQPTVALSSTEAEYMALTEAVNELEHLRQLLGSLHQEPPTPSTIFEDNQGALKLAANHQLQRRSKHIAVRYHRIREVIEAGVVQLMYINTKQQLADALTKHVGRATLELLASKIFTFVA
jgi:hypothetical protein